MENLLQKDPSINVVHTINEPAAAGAYEALKAFGKEKRRPHRFRRRRLPGRRRTSRPASSARPSQQYPLMMASLGVEAIKKFADTGEKPKPTEGKNFFDTGVALVTDKPVHGVESDRRQGRHEQVLGLIGLGYLPDISARVDQRRHGCADDDSPYSDPHRRTRRSHCNDGVPFAVRRQMRGRNSMSATRRQSAANVLDRAAHGCCAVSTPGQAPSEKRPAFPALQSGIRAADRSGAVAGDLCGHRRLALLHAASAVAHPAAGRDRRHSSALRRPWSS